MHGLKNYILYFLKVHNTIYIFIYQTYQVYPPSINSLQLISLWSLSRKTKHENLILPFLLLTQLS